MRAVRTGISFLLGLSLYYYIQWGSADFTVFDFYRATAGGLYVALIDVLWRIVAAKIDTKVSWKSQFKTRFALGILLQFSMLFVGPWIAFQIYEAPIDLVLKYGIVSFFLVLLTAVVDFTIYSFNYYSRGQIENIQLQREQLELQYEALRTQLSPHYLFNSLNTISSLISDNPKPAEQFARRLVETYQYIIQSRNVKLVSIKAELDFVKAYMYLIRVRFDESITTTINIDQSIMDNQIPPLTLQILIENAVKHNYFSADEPLVVTIDTDQNGNLIVKNENRQKDELVDSFRIGLDNIKKRYGFFTNEPVLISNHQVFQVTLPILPKPVVA